MSLNDCSAFRIFTYCIFRYILYVLSSSLNNQKVKLIRKLYLQYFICLDTKGSQLLIIASRLISNLPFFFFHQGHSLLNERITLTFESEALGLSTLP